MMDSTLTMTDPLEIKEANLNTDVDSNADADAEAPAAPEAYKGGPRTPEGKARSRRNALKHGLRAQQCILEDLHRQRELCRLTLQDEIQPQTLAERFYLGRAALAMARVEVASNKIEVAAEARSHKALRNWKIKQRAKIRKLAQNLVNDPRGTMDQLEATGFGIDWMMNRWEELLDTLQMGHSWSPEQVALAFRLSGFDPTEPLETLLANPSAAMLHQLTSAEEDRAEAYATLQRLVSKILAKLDARCREFFERYEAPMMRHVALSARIDDSAEGLRLQRYERDSEAAAHRNLKAVEQACKNRLRSQSSAPNGAPSTSKTARKSAPIPPGLPTLAEATAFVDLSISKAPNELPDGPDPASIDGHKRITLNDLKQQFRRVRAEEKRRTKAAKVAERKRQKQQKRASSPGFGPGIPTPLGKEPAATRVERFLDVG